MRRFKLQQLLFGMLCGVIAEPAVAQFFFIIPIPKGPSDPDKLNATIQQRQYAMCAALHSKVLDPKLSGGRSTSWRREVANAAELAMSDYRQFTDLRNRYARQWGLQAKSSYEAGTAYSKTLQNGCINSGLPYAEEQYAIWKKESSLTGKPLFSSLADREATPRNSLDRIGDISFTKDLLSQASILLDLEISKDGRVKACRSYITAVDSALEKDACEQLANEPFNPKIEDSLPTSGFFQVYATRQQTTYSLMETKQATQNNFSSPSTNFRYQNETGSNKNLKPAMAIEGVNKFYEYDYPPNSRKALEQGVVRASYVVGPDGNVTNCSVVQSSGFEGLDTATCIIIERRFKFSPALQNGQPVSERKFQPVRWSLRDPQPLPPDSASVNSNTGTAGESNSQGVVNGKKNDFSDQFLIDRARQNCQNLGFTQGTQQFADCALRLFERK